MAVCARYLPSPEEPSARETQSAKWSLEKLNGKNSAGAAVEDVQDFAQALADVLQFGGGASGERDGGLRLVGFNFGAQLLAGAGDGESFFVEQLLDAKNALDVASPIHSLAGTAFNRLELGEFGFPEAKHVGGQAAESGYFANAEVEFVGDQDFVARRSRGLAVGRSGFFHAHFFAPQWL